MESLFMATASAIAAVLGGALAFSQRRKLSLMLSFTAGALLGLVAFDILPQVFELVKSSGIDIVWPMIALAGGFLFFHSIERLILIHHSNEGDYVIHAHPHVGIASSLALIGHSFLDGTAIGVAFQIDSSVGVAVSIAVIGHRFADGFNSVSLMLVNKTSQQTTKRILAFVALAPIAGLLFAQLFTLKESVIAVYLGFFAGFLLYISASEILPQAHSKTASQHRIILSFVGVLFMLVISTIAINS